MNFGQYLKSFITHLGVGAISFLISGKAIAAERITLNVPPFGQFYVQIDDLENFVQTGEATPELAYYLKRLSPRQVEKLPELLSTQLEVNPLSIAKFTKSTVGEAVIQNFGKGIRADVGLNGFFALRGAIIAAAFDERGLTVMNLLNQFPLENIYVDLPVLNQYLKRGATLLRNRDALEEEFFADNEANLNIVNQTPPLENLERTGVYKWKKSTKTFRNPRRSQNGYFDLYQPKTELSVPLVIISHGLFSNRQTFGYLAQHFASYGLAVAVIEHDDISLNKFDHFLSGTEKFPEPNSLIDQPLDVKYLIDQLELESQLNLQNKYKINFAQIGVIGQSFGGYTSLALAGGGLIADHFAEECQPESYRDVLLDLSSLARCTLNELEDSRFYLRDPRIKAAISINPFGKVFGASGLEKIEIPTMIIAGTQDIFLPPVSEQIKPFTWLNEDLNKYLVLMKSGTHFSFLREGSEVFPISNNIVGTSPSSAYSALQALGTAFFKAHLTHEWKYQTYLTNEHIKVLNNNKFQFRLLHSLTELELQKIIGK